VFVEPAYHDGILLVWNSLRIVKSVLSLKTYRRRLVCGVSKMEVLASSYCSSYQLLGLVLRRVWNGHRVSLPLIDDRKDPDIDDDACVCAAATNVGEM
jgi:hypothetical protein